MKDYKEIAENVLKRRDEYIRIQKRKRSMIVKTVSSFCGVAAAACVSIAIYNNSTVQEIKPDFHGNPYDSTELTRPTAEISTETATEPCTTAVNTVESSVNTTSEVSAATSDETTYTTVETAVSATETACVSSTEYSRTTVSTAVEIVTIPVSKTTSAFQGHVTAISTVPCATEISNISQTTNLQTTSVKNITKTTAETEKTTLMPYATTVIMQNTTMEGICGTTGAYTSLPYLTEVPSTTGETTTTTIYTTTADIDYITVTATTDTTEATFTEIVTFVVTTTKPVDLSTDEPLPVTDTTTYLYVTTTFIPYFSYNSDDVYITTYTTIID